MRMSPRRVARSGVESDQRAGCPRYGAWRHGVRALRQRRPERDLGRDRVSPQCDHPACGAASVAFGLSLSLLRQRGRPRRLWAEYNRAVSARGQIRGSHSQGRKASRPAGAGADQVRNWWSISKPTRRSAWTCHQRCSPAPTRWSNKGVLLRCMSPNWQKEAAPLAVKNVRVWADRGPAAIEPTSQRPYF